MSVAVATEMSRQENETSCGDVTPGAAGFTRKFFCFTIGWPSRKIRTVKMALASPGSNVNVTVTGPPAGE